MRRDFNGKMMNIVLDGDPYYFYRGRVQFSGVEVSTSGDGNKVKLDYNLMPYKYNREYMTNPLDKILYLGSLTQEQRLIKAANPENAFKEFDVIPPRKYISFKLFSDKTNLSIYTTANLNAELINKQNDYLFTVPQGNNLYLYATNNEGTVKVHLSKGINVLILEGQAHVQLDFVEARL